MQFVGIPGLAPRALKLYPYDEARSNKSMTAEWEAGEALEGKAKHAYSRRGVTSAEAFCKIMWAHFSPTWDGVSAGDRYLLEKNGVDVMLDMSTEFDFENMDVRGYCISAPLSVPMSGYYKAAHGARPTAIVTLVARGVSKTLECDMDGFILEQWQTSPFFVPNSTFSLLSQVVSVSRGVPEGGGKIDEVDIYFYMRLALPGKDIPRAGQQINTRLIDVTKFVKEAKRIAGVILEDAGAGGHDLDLVAFHQTNVFHEGKSMPSPTGVRSRVYYFCNNHMRVAKGDTFAVFDIEAGIPVIARAEADMQVPVGDTFVDLHTDAKADKSGVDFLSFDVDGVVFARTKMATMRASQGINNYPSAVVRALGSGQGGTALAVPGHCSVMHRWSDAVSSVVIDDLPPAQQVRYHERLGTEYVRVDPSDKAKFLAFATALGNSEKFTYDDIRSESDGALLVPLELYAQF